MLASTSLATLFALALSATFSAPANAHTVDLHKRDIGLKNADGAINLDVLDKETARLTLKYRRNTETWRYHAFGGLDPSARMAREKRANAGNLMLTQEAYAIWTGTVSVGTPAQDFNMYFDTGSSDFTVASTQCPASSCGTKDRYDVSASSSAVKTSKTVRTNFVDGTSSAGPVVEDIVSIAGTVANKQDVVAATSLSSSVANIASDGMGLAYPALSSAYSSSYMFTLASQGTYIYPWFSMRLTNQGQSSITFGSFNRRYVAGVTRWFNVAQQAGTSYRTYWQIGASTPLVNGQQAIANRVNHILDSGTTLIIAPPSAAAEFWANVPGSQVYNSQYWTYPCDTPPTVSFSFARLLSTTYDVLPEEFNLGYLPSDNTRCVGAVVGSNLGLGTSWILGDAFLTNVYVIHDVQNNRIGLAPPRY
ncbi:hypothetical protein JCM8202_001389 [Rhodotorula sphaerocarpa]